MIIRGSLKYRLSPKITKMEYVENTKQIESLKKEIKDVQDNVLKYVLNIQEIINKEVLDLKNKKNSLLTIKDKSREVFKLGKRYWNVNIAMG